MNEGADGHEQRPQRQPGDSPAAGGACAVRRSAECPKAGDWRLFLQSAGTLHTAAIT